MTLPTISRREARRAALAAQGLSGARPRTTAAALAALGAIQIDTISVLARSHLLTVRARTGPIAATTIERALWPKGAPSAFEYWSHAACILPIARWPEFAFRRRARTAKGRRWHHLEDQERSIATVRNVLADGPASTFDLGGAQKGGTWWDWTEEKIAIEWLLDTGEVVCTRREGFRRVYDLAERAIPPDLLAIELDDDECRRRLVTEAARALGVATVPEIARHHGMTIREAQGAISEVDLEPVAVEGRPAPHYALPGTIDRLIAPARVRPTLLSPFDSFVWDRERIAALFGFIHRIEAYTPAPARIHGYYPMPILTGGGIVGRVDPKRVGDCLVIRQASFAPGTVDLVARAIADAARSVGAMTVVVERTDPELARVDLARLANAGLDPEAP